MATQHGRRVSIRQMELLVEYMEGHESLALGRYLTKEGRALSKSLWNECAANLNSVGDGAYKSAVEWSHYWSDLKNRTKTKLRRIARSRSGTGGGPPDIVALTSLEERIIRILGEDVTTPLGGVPSTGTLRDDTLATDTSMHQGVGHGSSTSEENILLIVSSQDAAEQNIAQTLAPLVLEAASDADVAQPSTSHGVVGDSVRATTERHRIRRPRTRQSTSVLDRTQQTLANIELQKVRGQKMLARALKLQALALNKMADAMAQIPNSLNSISSAITEARTNIGLVNSDECGAGKGAAAAAACRWQTLGI